MTKLEGTVTACESPGCARRYREVRFSVTPAPNLLLLTWPAAQASSPQTPVPLIPLPKEPAGLAATLFRIETALRNRSTRASERLEMSHLQQRLYRRLGRNRGLAAAVRPLLPIDLRDGYDHHISARQALEAMVPAGRPPLATVAAWRIIQPASAEALLPPPVCPGRSWPR